MNYVSVIAEEILLKSIVQANLAFSFICIEQKILRLWGLQINPKSKNHNINQFPMLYHPIR